MLMNAQMSGGVCFLPAVAGRDLDPASRPGASYDMYDWKSVTAPWEQDVDRVKSQEKKESRERGKVANSRKNV